MMVCRLLHGFFFKSARSMFNEDYARTEGIAIVMFAAKTVSPRALLSVF